MGRSTTARGVVAAVVAVVALVVGAGPASAELNPTDLRSTTDTYLFDQGLATFTATRDARPYANQLDWSSDGCSKSPDNPFGFNFVRACHRHDFGYRNYRLQGRFDENTRLTIDNRFKSDMYTICNGNWACKRLADVYYAAVRSFAGRS